MPAEEVDGPPPESAPAQGDVLATFTELLRMRNELEKMEEEDPDNEKLPPRHLRDPATRRNLLTPRQAPEGTPISELRAEADRLAQEHGPQHAEVASARARLADALRCEALLCGCPISTSECQFLRETLELCCRVQGQAHPDAVLAACALSSYLVSHDEALEAEDVLKGPLEEVTHKYGAGLHNTLAAFLMLGLATSLTAQLHLQDLEEINPFSRALVIFRAQYGDDSVHVRDMLAVTADFFLAQANHKQAQNGYLVVQHETVQDLNRAEEEEERAEKEEREKEKQQQGGSEQDSKVAKSSTALHAAQHAACLRARVLSMQLTRVVSAAAQHNLQESEASTVRDLWSALQETVEEVLAARDKDKACGSNRQETAEEEKAARDKDEACGSNRLETAEEGKAAHDKAVASNNRAHGLWGKLPACAIDAMLAQLPHVLHALKDNDAAEACARLLLRVREAACTGGTDEEQRMQVACARLGLGIVLGSYQGKKEEAGQLLVELRADTRRAWGSTHPLTLDVTHALAENMRSRGHRKEALPLYDHVLVVRTMKRGPTHPSVITAAQTQGECKLELGLLDQAEGLLRDVEQVRTALLGSHHPETVHTTRCLAAIHTKRGNHEEAAISLLCAYANICQLFGSRHPQSLRTGIDLAGALENMGGTKDAARLYVQMQPHVRRVFGAGSSELREVEAGIPRCGGDPDRKHKMKAARVEEKSDASDEEDGDGKGKDKRGVGCCCVS